MTNDQPTTGYDKHLADERADALRAALEGLVKPATFVYENVRLDEPVESALGAALDAADTALAS